MGTQTRPISPAWMSAWQGVGQMSARGGESRAQGIAGGAAMAGQGIDIAVRTREAETQRAFIEGEHALDRELRKDTAGKALDMRAWELQARKDQMLLKHFGDRAKDLDAEAAFSGLLGNEDEQKRLKSEAHKWSVAQDTITQRMSRPPVVTSNDATMRGITRKAKSG